MGSSRARAFDLKNVDPLVWVLKSIADPQPAFWNGSSQRARVEALRHQRFLDFSPIDIAVVESGRRFAVCRSVLSIGDLNYTITS